MTTYCIDNDTTRRPGRGAWTTAILGWPLSLLTHSVETVGRRRDAAQHRADLAALDPRLLADIGLRRSLADPAYFLDARGG